LKIEDPVMVVGADEEPFLMRLPIRVRLSCSLSQLVHVLGAIQATNPMMDIEALKVQQGELGVDLEAEMMLSRYLLLAAPSEEDEEEIPRDEA